MRGIDGNFMSAQGDNSARVQMAYQAAQVAQQVHAQKEAADSFRKLREVVSEAGKKEAAPGTPVVGNDENSKSRDYEPTEGNPQGGGSAEVDEAEGEGPTLTKRSHIDIRV